MIRILHVLGGLERGGAETIVMNLYRRIDRDIIQFDFIVHTPEKQAYYEEILSLGGRIYHFPAFNGKNIFHLEKLWSDFFNSHPEYRILHSHIRSYASLYLPIAKKHGLKTIIHSHSTSNGKGISAMVKNVMQYPLRYQADYLMTCSNEAGKWLYGTRACSKSNYIFFPNAVDVDKYLFSQTTADAYRKELGVEEKFVIGHVGRFHEAKNHMFLLDIFSGICAKRDDAVLLLVGDGELREKITAKIHTLGLEDRVILTGSRSDVPQLMQAMDVFAFPSAWEGLPVTVIEAQAAGLPCLISETITQEVDISELVNRLPIHNADIWVETLMKMNVERKDVVEKIKLAGFDVKNAVSMLVSLYYALERDE